MNKIQKFIRKVIYIWHYLECYNLHIPQTILPL
nr:MAG TPA: hypothetical protein [Caudoviricetes sp.]